MSASVQYPPSFFQRVLAQEAPGGPAVSLSLVQPSVSAMGIPGTLKLAVLDAQGYPSLEYEGTVTITDLPDGPLDIAFHRGAPAVASIDNVVLPTPGVYRFTAHFAGGIAAGNPTCCREQVQRYLYWGDPHVHTVLGNCHADTCRSLNFCYTAARYLTGLDWVAAADHVSNGRCDFPRWKEQRLVCDAQNDPGAFATLHAYEASLQGGAGGDNNVYLARPLPLFIDEYEEGTVRTLCEKLAGQLAEEEFFVVPHHTTRTGKHGEISDAIYAGPQRMPLVEIHSKWGTSEYRGNPNPLKQIHPGPSYVTDFLNRGLPFGFIAGTDTHATMPSGSGVEPGHIDRLPGITAVAAPALSREAIFRGLRGRQCYAASLERIYLDLSIAGAQGGETVAVSDTGAPRPIAATIAAQSDIVSVEIIRNGEVIHRQSGEGWQAAVLFTDADDLRAHLRESPHLGPCAYYYLRVTCASGAQAWSSPVWLAGTP